MESMIVAFLTPHAAFLAPLVVPSAAVAMVVAIFSDKVARLDELGVVGRGIFNEDPPRRTERSPRCLHG